MISASNISIFLIGSVTWNIFIFSCIVANVENAIFQVKASESISPAPTPSVDHLKDPEAQCLSQIITLWWSDEYINTSTSHCNWPGVTCNHAGKVTELSSPSRVEVGSTGLVFQKLNLACLPNLVYLSFSRAGLTGGIPREIGSLSKLTHLYLSWNRLTGEWPLSTLANLSDLVELDLSFNQLSGPIPSTIGLLKNLVVLNLRENLGSLDISDNNLSGPIFQSLSGLASLAYLDMSTNHFDGPIGPDIGNLKQMFKLDISNNEFSGTIPRQIAQLIVLEHLNLSQNNLRGRIPIEICASLYLLKTLDLSHNFLGGKIPSQLCSMIPLETINLAFNNFSGDNNCSSQYCTDGNLICVPPYSQKKGNGVISQTEGKVHSHSETFNI